MVRLWSTPEIRQLITGRTAIFTDVSRRRVPTPLDLADVTDTESPSWWTTDLTPVYAADRTRLIRAFNTALHDPGMVVETTVRVQTETGWTQQRIRYLNLLDHVHVGALLTVIDGAELLPHFGARTSTGLQVDPAVTPWARHRLDPSATICDADGMVEALYGRSRRDLIGRNMLELVHGDDIPRCLEATMAGVSQPGVNQTVVHRLVRPDGSATTVETTFKFCTDDDGHWSVHLRDAALGMRSDLRRGLDGNQFVLHYQPSLDIDTGHVVGAEALVRWNHPTRGLVPPLEFIPWAEDSGLIVELGAWVVRTACAEAATWPGDLHVAVNLSVRQLADDSIVRTVDDALRSSGLDPNRLVLEVTESAVMDNAEMALADLKELKGLGVRLAIDDFGTGYSSLVYLKRMPVDAIKIDRAFVDGLGSDPEDTAIVTSVVSLAHAFGIAAVAEGVETFDQHRQLAVLGCDSAQGFLWSKPVAADEFRAFVLDRRATPPAYPVAALQTATGAGPTISL